MEACLPRAFELFGLAGLTASSYPMDINCIIHCWTSGRLRSQRFLLVLLSFARNSWALEGGMATADFGGALPASATGWKEFSSGAEDKGLHLKTTVSL